jgi:Glycosyltransferase family 28 C-terminal domain
MIGYYVHHVGHGHAIRATCIAACSRQQIIALSSLDRPQDWQGDWVTLPLDAPLQTGSCRTQADGRLHWAPLAHTGYRRRMELIAAWIIEHRPHLMVTDVSVEVAALARLLAVPVVTIGMPGSRTDHAHQLGYGLSESIVAPWPSSIPPEPCPEQWLAKTVHVGAFSRFDRRTPPHRITTTRPGRVVALFGRGDTEHDRGPLERAISATPEWKWTVLGPDCWIPDPWSDLCNADVAVTHAGQNAVAEVAAARAPAVVIAHRRPFDEQAATARTLDRAGLCVAVKEWPSDAQWPGLLEEALRRGGDRWSEWAPGDGAERAAAHLDRLAASAGAPSPT